MSAANPTRKFISFALTLLLLLSFFISITAHETSNGDGDEDFEGIEDLIALDEEEKEGSHLKSSEAEVIAKAQRIVLELSSDNTKRIIDGNEFVLVLGYAAWRPRSAELMPRFAEAATSLKELGSPILMAKLDAELHPKTASSLGFSGFTTLLLFTNGTSQPYTGGFSSEEMVIWVRKKTGVPVIRINSVTEADAFLKKHQIFAIGLFKKFAGHEYEEFIKAATSHNEIQFIEVNNVEIAKVLYPNIKPDDLFLGLVKSEMERYTAEVTVKSLTVNNFYAGAGCDFSGVPTKMLTVNGSLRISVYNPATLFGIHVSSTPINLVYSEIVVATGQLKKYYQPRKSRRTVSVMVEGTKVPLYGAGSGLAVSSNNNAVECPLTLELEIKSRGDVVGKLVRTKHRRVSCPLVVDSARTKPIKFKKNTCTYD